MPSLRLIPFTLALWVATAAAADSNNNTLPAIMGRFAPCVMLCYHAAAVDSECSVGDFKCVCSNPGSLVVKMGLCVGKACDDVPQCLGSKPDGSKPCDSGELMQDVCGRFKESPPSSEISSASKLAVSAYSSVSATATSDPAPKATNAAVMGPHPPAITEAAAVGMMGIAAIAALVL